MMEKIVTATELCVASAGGWFAYLLGGFDTILTTLLILMATDYVSGVLKAIYNKKLNSNVGFRGIIKKVMLLLVVVLASTLQKNISDTIPLREVVIMFYIANEGLSIIENLSAVIPIPDTVKEFFEQLKKTD